MTAAAVVLTVQLALVTTVLLMLVGVPIAYALAFGRGPWRPWAEAAVALPLVLPPTVLGFYLLVAMGPGGWLGQLWQQLFQQRLAFSFTALVIASVCYSLPFAVQPVQAAFQGLDPRLREAAWTLGASRWRTFRDVVAPNCMAGLVSGAVLAFAHTVGEFGVVLMVGGNIPGETRTVSIAMYDLVEALAYDEASRLAVGLLLGSYTVLLGLFLFQRRSQVAWRKV